jgi:hypothetical protein
MNFVGIYTGFMDVSKNMAPKPVNGEPSPKKARASWKKQGDKAEMDESPMDYSAQINKKLKRHWNKLSISRYWRRSLK